MRSPAAVAATAALAGLVGLAGLAGAPRVARAAPNDEQVAQSLFETARQLMDRGDYTRACPMFEESQRLDPGGGTLLNLAICHENEGKTATAYFELQQALTQAVKDGRKDREDVARAHVAALAPKLARLLVRVPPPLPEGFTIAIDGSAVTPAILDVPTPVDPGKHSVQVAAPGYETLRWEGEVTAGTTAEASIPMRIVRAESAPEPERSAGGGGGIHLRGALAIGGIALGAVSAAAFVLSYTARSSALDKCIPDRSYCSDSDGVDAVARARTFAWISIGSAVGAAALGVASLVVHDPKTGTAVGVRPEVGGLSFAASRSF